MAALLGASASYQSTAITAAMPYWIERRSPVFAYYHGPTSRVRDLGIVLCKPFGYEMLCAHRAYRHLAEKLAVAGFPTLRLDYEGTGDSSGDLEAPGRFAAWLDSIREGVADLERRGVRRIALVGVRFGALLAAEFAKKHPVDALVLVAPPASGRAYLRELRAFQAMRAGTADGAPKPSNGDEEAVGFLLTRETTNSLEKSTVCGDARPAPRILIVARDDMKGPEGKIAAQLTSLGANVTVSHAPGYAAMMQEDPVKSLVPTAIWSEIEQYLSSAPTGTISELLPRSQQFSAIVHSDAPEREVLEEIVDVDGMFGILCSPVEASRRTAPTILLHNVGANHHIGCNRLYVDLARRWASLGFSVLRFDLVGIGDTPARGGRPENEVYAGACVIDSRRAMNWLASARGLQRFVLGGICSGAYVSYYAALEDPRVWAVMMMNPLTFHWHEGDSLDVSLRATLKSTHFYRNAALEWETWRRLARGQVNLGVLAKNMATRVFARVSESTAQWMGTENDVARGFRQLLDRGTRVTLVCGEDDGSRDVVAEHLGPDANRLRRRSNFRFEIVPHTDHTFSPRAAQRDLSERLTTFLLRTDRASRRVPPRDSGGPPPSAWRW